MRRAADGESDEDGGAGEADRRLREGESLQRRDGGHGARHGGTHALRIDSTPDSHWVSLDTPAPGPQQNWTGYDFLKMDVYTDDEGPDERLRGGAGYGDHRTTGRGSITRPSSRRARARWSIPVKQLYVGEKTRPGRMLILAHHPLRVQHRRQARQRRCSWTTSAWSATSRAEGAVRRAVGLRLRHRHQPGDGRLHADHAGHALQQGPRLRAADAHVWRAFDVLQPDPLYQDFICIESGGLAVDVPNGKYRVFVNIDNPSGFWGEYQVYRKRAILAKGKPVVRRHDGLRGFAREVLPLLERRGLARATTPSTSTRRRTSRRRPSTST